MGYFQELVLVFMQSSGSESSSLLISLDATKFVLLIIFTLKETIC